MTVGALPSRSAAEALTEFLHRQYPHIEDLELLELSKLGDGWETDLYHLEIAGTQDRERISQALVLRLYKGADPFEKAQKEFSLLTGVLQYGIRTPRVDALVADRSILEHPFIIMEYIQGGTLQEDIEKKGASPRLHTLMELLARIHALPWVELVPHPNENIPLSNEPHAYVYGLLDEMGLSVERYGLDGYDPILSWLRDRVALGSSQRAALIHNDYHPQNILVSGDSLVVIDWSFASIGDFRMDLAWSLLLFDVMVEGNFRAAMLDAYEQVTGSKVENLEFFEALKFTLRMVTIGTWLDESVKIPVAGIRRRDIRGDYKVHVMNPYRRLKEITGLEIRSIEEL